MSLKELRTMRGLSQKELATQTGLKLGTIQCYEQGKKNINGAKLKTILVLASALKCGIADIVTDEETKQLLNEVHNGNR